MDGAAVASRSTDTGAVVCLAAGIVVVSVRAPARTSSLARTIERFLFFSQQAMQASKREKRE